MEYLARRKNGEEFPVGLTMSSWHVGPQVFFTAILRDLTEHKAAAERVQATLKRLRAAMDGVVQAMALTVERRAPYTAGHQRRVANLARAIGQRLGLSPNQIDGIRVAGVIHDLGKIAIPAEILSKPGRLNDYELGLMRTHPEVGYEILSGVDFAWPVAEIVRQHHERWDGSGYPRGLSGEGILPEARILAVADVVEAVSSYRPYRPALGLEAALEELAKGRGTAFEPQVVDACLDVFRKGFRLEPGVREQPEH
jgi:HD-GYP domain-containing protein (c-di-GMP phosphodiesterase class II)